MNQNFLAQFCFDLEIFDKKSIFLQIFLTKSENFFLAKFIC